MQPVILKSFAYSLIVCFIVKIGGKSGRILAKARPGADQFCTTQRLVVLSGTRPLSHVRCSGNRLNHTSPVTTAHPTTQLPLSRSLSLCMHPLCASDVVDVFMLHVIYISFTYSCFTFVYKSCLVIISSSPS